MHVHTAVRLKPGETRRGGRNTHKNSVFCNTTKQLFREFNFCHGRIIMLPFHVTLQTSHTEKTRHHTTTLKSCVAVLLLNPEGRFHVPHTQVSKGTTGNTWNIWCMSNQINDNHFNRDSVNVNQFKQNLHSPHLYKNPFHKICLEPLPRAHHRLFPAVVHVAARIPTYAAWMSGSCIAPPKLLRTASTRTDSQAGTKTWNQRI